MTNKKISETIRTSDPNEERFFEKMYRLVIGNPSNRCILKTNMKLRFLKAFIGNKQWIRRLDNKLYLVLLTDICELIAELLEAHKDCLTA